MKTLARSKRDTTKCTKNSECVHDTAHSLLNIHCSKKKNENVCYEVNRLGPSCPCHQFKMTGKLCAHLWAAEWYETNGPIEQWEGKQTYILDVSNLLIIKCRNCSR